MTTSSGKFTYWSLLGLSPGSKPEELKKAFIREARAWHPDLNKNNRNAEERFKWINEAYLVLSDPKKRFEWEISGRPPIEIKSFAELQSPKKTSQKPVSKSTNVGSGFNSVEKLILILISSFFLFFLNAFNS